MGKIVDVLGLGPSLELYQKNGNLTIGVNDIWSRVKADYIVCLDRKAKFTPERLKVIEESKPVKFYSIFPLPDKLAETDWSDRPDFEKIELQPYYPNYGCTLKTKALPMSHCSPFVACAVAFKFHQATEIHLYGVDLLSHPHLDFSYRERIKVHFRNLKIALRQSGCELVIFGNGILKNL